MKNGRLALIAFVVLLVGCSQANGRTGSIAGNKVNGWTKPHVLTISDGADIDTLNPHLSQFATVANLSELTMAWLLRWDAHNQLYPELATEVPTKANGGVSQDGLTITYHLRRGVKWSDGAPFDADDVLFSTAVVNNPKNDEGVRFDMIARVDEPDKYTVVYHLKKPMSTAVEAFFTSCCANPSLLPKHLLARYDTINHVPYNNLPIGIGPFKYSSWVRSKEVVLDANPLYWRGRPRLDQVVYKILPGRGKVLAALQAHNIDMWFKFTNGAVLPQVEAISGVGEFRQPSYGYEHIDFNLTHPVVSELSVRQALRLALDRKELVQNIEHGIGIVQDSATPVGAPYFADMRTTPYDPAKANALLDGAGWKRGSDGFRTKGGIKLALNIAVPIEGSVLDKTVDFVRNDWRQIGVATSVHYYPVIQFFAPAQRGGIPYGDKWDVVMFGWAADPMGDYSSIYGCDSFPPAGFNNLHWCNKRADAAMNALKGHYAQSQRNADVRTVMTAFVQDVPSIVLALNVDLFAYNKDLKNYNPGNITPFDNMMDVDI